MSSEQANGEVDQAQASHGPRECMPCRGSGKVISNLGGAAEAVRCPWCAGTGVRSAEIDAQARWPGADGAATAAADAEPG